MHMFNLFFSCVVHGLKVVPDMTDSTTPITVTVGGVRMMPSFDNEKKLVLNSHLTLFLYSLEIIT